MASERGRVHALIVGISAYPYLREDAPEDGPTLGLLPLESAALAAYRVHEHIAEMGFAGRATGRLQLLVAPSEAEMREEPALESVAGDCTWGAVARAAKEWRAAASADPDDAALFYFAGHGLQRRSDEHVLLLADFGDGEGGSVLHHALDTDHLIDGMAVGDAQPDIARLQFYVFDACRADPGLKHTHERLDVPRVWDPVVSTNEQAAARRSPAIHTALPGSRSYGIPGHQSVFSAAFVECLRGAGADADQTDGETRWRVTGGSLISGIDRELERLNALYRVPQRCESNRVPSGLVLHELDAPPYAELRVIVRPEEQEAFACAALEVTDAATDTTAFVRPSPFDPHPFTEIVPAGIYRARIEISPPHERFRTRTNGRMVRPPTTDLVVKVVDP